MAATEQPMTRGFAGQPQSSTRAWEGREEWQQLDNGKGQMASFSKNSATDLVEINVGGKVMTTRLGTLQLVTGTFLETMFSGRWDESLECDGAGRIFLDFSPTPFKALLSFLRAMRDKEPGEHVDPPVVPPEYTAEYKAMIRYLGLADLFRSSEAHTPSAGALVCSQSTGGTRDGSIRCEDGVLCRRAGRGTRCAVGGMRLLGDDPNLEQVAWKVTVRGLGSQGQGSLCAGVIGHSSPGDTSFLHPACFAWGWNTGVLLGGRIMPGHGGWDAWESGDVAVFQLHVSEGLRMFLRRTGRVYHVQGMSADAAREARVHLNLCGAGTEVEVSQATTEDLREAGF